MHHELEKVTARLLYFFLVLVTLVTLATAAYVAAAPPEKVQQSIALSYQMLRCVMSALMISSCGCLAADIYIKFRCSDDN